MNKKFLILIIIGVLLILVGGILYFKYDDKKINNVKIGVIENDKVCNYQKILYTDSKYAYFVPCNYDYIAIKDNKKYSIEEALKNNLIFNDELNNLLENSEKKTIKDFDFEIKVPKICKLEKINDSIYTFCLDDIYISIDKGNKILLKDTLDKDISSSEFIAYMLYLSDKTSTYSNHNVYESFEFSILECKDKFILSYSGIDYLYDICE